MFSSRWFAVILKTARQESLKGHSAAGCSTPKNFWAETFVLLGILPTGRLFWALPTARLLPPPVGARSFADLSRAVSERKRQDKKQKKNVKSSTIIRRHTQGYRRYIYRARPRTANQGCVCSTPRVT